MVVAQSVLRMVVSALRYVCFEAYAASRSIPCADTSADAKTDMAAVPLVFEAVPAHVPPMVFVSICSVTSDVCATARLSLHAAV